MTMESQTFWGPALGPGGPPEGPGWEAVLSRWLPRLALVGALGAGGLWWVSASQPIPPDAPGDSQAQGKKDRSSGCDCQSEEGCVGCAEVGCEGADCLSGLGDCGACDCGAIDCGGCDCGAIDCGGLDCGGCVTTGLRGGVGVRGAAVGASCPRRGASPLTVLALAAPLALFALWRASSPKDS